MAQNNALDQLNDVFDSLFSGGTRYQLEKIVTVVVYVIISGASLVWAFSGSSADNELGADFQIKELAEIDDQNFYLINDSDEVWTNVRVVINRKFLWTADKVAADGQETLQPADFEYYFYIPRPWGRTDWEQLAAAPKPDRDAPPLIDVKLVEIRANEGRSDVTFGGGPKEKGESNVAKAQ